jgi:hypothetical protein
MFFINELDQFWNKFDSEKGVVCLCGFLDSTRFSPDVVTTHSVVMRTRFCERCCCEKSSREDQPTWQLCPIVCPELFSKQKFHVESICKKLPRRYHRQVTHFPIISCLAAWHVCPSLWVPSRPVKTTQSDLDMFSTTTPASNRPEGPGAPRNTWVSISISIH